jgi:hypothetical protein
LAHIIGDVAFARELLFETGLEEVANAYVHRREGKGEE